MTPDGEAKMIKLLEDISRKLTQLQHITQGTGRVTSPIYVDGEGGSGGTLPQGGGQVMHSFSDSQ
ncbi:MAG: hypothetical protein Q7T86_03065 [Hyphomicrobiaceae bacterium]|nr:hypothetical protein [Hyphomicrobiaceae bacterium]